MVRLGKRTVYDWITKLRLSENPRDAAKPLLSSAFTLEEKVRVQQAMTIDAVEVRDGMEWLEILLVQASQFKIAQMVRWDMFWYQDEQRKRGLEWCQAMIEADIKTRWLVQREIFIREELRAARKSVELSIGDERSVELSSGDKGSVDATTVHSYEKDLKHLDEEYISHCKDLWKLRAMGPVGPLNRAFQAYRKDPEWYLCAWLREDCAGRGGCCGRDCGCCKKARDTDRKHNEGHCASACACCIRSQNYDHGKQPDMEKVQFYVVANKNTYDRRMLRAYIFGLSFLDELALI